MATAKELSEREIDLIKREAAADAREALLAEQAAAMAPVPYGEHRVVEIKNEVINDLQGKSRQYNSKYATVVEEFHLPQLTGKGPLVRTQGKPLFPETGDETAMTPMEGKS
jgi:hypothetical protein